LRPKNIDVRVPKTLSLDLDVYREFEKIVGTGNISDEIRAFMKDRVEQAKKEEGMVQTNPLNLVMAITNTNNSNNNKHNSIFQFIDVVDNRPELVKYIDTEPSISKFDVLFKNCKAIVKIIEKRRNELAVLSQAEKRNSPLNSNDKIIAEIRAQRRRVKI